MARAAAARPWFPGVHGFAPFRAIFRLLTSVRFAIASIALVAAAGVIGVALPQMPGFVRTHPDLRAAWIAEHGRPFGALTPLAARLQLFEVFHSVWFYSLVGVVLLSVAVCSSARFMPTWRSIRRPQVTVPDRYFETAHHRASFAGNADAGRLAAVLRKHHYSVRTESLPAATNLYADRFAWSRLATFATHLSLLMLMVGGLVTWTRGYSEDMLIAEGESHPVLSATDPAHLQVKVERFVRTQDSAGRDSDIHTDIVIYRGGREVARGETDINHPFMYGGFAFHQSAYSQKGAALEIRDPTTGHVLYDEVLNLFGQLPMPRVTVMGADGTQIFDGVVPPTFFPQDGVSAGTLPVAGQGTLIVAVQQLKTADGGPPFELIVSGANGEVGQARFGEMARVGGLQVRFANLESADYFLADNLPGANGKQTLVESAPTADGRTQLIAVPQGGQPVAATESRPANFGGYELRYLGPRQFSGITVKRDPGAEFIWVGAILLIGGLLVTFYVPRRRLWVKLTAEETRMAGVADRGAHFGREMLLLGAEAGLPVEREALDDNPEDDP